MNAASERLRWAVDALNVQPDHRLLEIRCGHGVVRSDTIFAIRVGIFARGDASRELAVIARHLSLHGRFLG